MKYTTSLNVLAILLTSFGIFAAINPGKIDILLWIFPRLKIPVIFLTVFLILAIPSIDLVYDYFSKPQNVLTNMQDDSLRSSRITKRLINQR